MERAFLIAGASGMLGTALQRVLSRRGAVFSAPAEIDFDICDEAAVARQVVKFRTGLGSNAQGVLFNAAAYTNVERAEDEPERAYLVNATGAANLARAARESGMGFVHVSTDFVFDGSKPGPYTEADEPHPLSVYGTSKLAGEQAVSSEHPEALIVRTAWVFGAGGVNFPLKVLRVARERGQLSVVTDERGSPTYTVDLATGILGLVDAGMGGLFNLVGSGSCSRYELALEVLRLTGLDVSVEPVLSAAFTSKAARPANSVLDCSRAAAAGVRMPSWRDGLARYVRELPAGSA